MNIDFSMLMFIALVLTGMIWLWGVWAAKRKSSNKTTEPLLVEYARAFFPVILIVFLLRSFLVEPFRIPSGSMLPSLLIGDFILVNKYKYGIRLPIVNLKIFNINTPQRGDIMVFRYPYNPSINYIKRVVGLPGDRIVYEDKTLYINGNVANQKEDGEYVLSDSGQRNISTRRKIESLGKINHAILRDQRVEQPRMEFEVPTGQYFVMGDNRDRSNDSRYWGYVDDGLVVGKAFFVWFSWDYANGGGVNWKRIGTVLN
ncbi:MAG TPA: signal peptidase I [Acidiferrobacteraceae bacterium]|nr:signal peptidase I [Acidiferrobacteraceae bacterium]